MLKYGVLEVKNEGIRCEIMSYIEKHEELVCVNQTNEWQTDGDG